MDQSHSDRQYMIRTLLGEAAQQPDEGVAAVAHVINNRRNSGRWGSDIRSVVLAKNQFEPWSTPEGRKRMMSVPQNDPAFQRAACIADGVLSGQIPDPTGGADHFLNEKVVRQRTGGALPKWAQNMSDSAHVIGDHIFYGGSGAARLQGGDTGPSGNADTLGFDEAEFEAFKREMEGGDAPQPLPGGGEPIVFDEEEFARFKEEASRQPKPQSAFEAFTSTYHPNLSPDEKEAMRTRMSNPARTGAAVANSFLPFSDEISAGLGAGLRTIGKAFTDEDMDFGGDYEKGLAYQRVYQAAEDELQGLTDEALGTVAAIGGGGGASLTRAGAKFLTSPSVAGRAAKATGAGATAGGVYGSGEGEGLGDRAERAAEGAVTGAVSGVVGNAVVGAIASVARTMGPSVARLLGRPGAVTPDGEITPATRAALEAADVNPDEVTAEFAKAFAQRSGLPPDQAARAATFDTLGVRGTRGQISGDVTDQAAEEAMRAGAQGGQPAANVMRQFDETQQQGLNRARDEFASNLGGGNVIAGDAVEASDMAYQGVQRRASEAKEAAQVFYRRAEDAGVTIAPEAFDDLLTRIDGRFAAAEVIVDPDTPIANRMLQVLRNRATRPEDAVGGVSLNLVDKTRGRISKALRDARQRGDTAEVEALSEMLSGVDDWTEDAVDSALMTGTPEALDALKAARSMWTQYRKTFFGKKGADKFIAKMVQDEAGPRDVFGWLYSNGRMGAGRQSTQFANRLKDILGENSPEWAALRQGAWAKLTKGVSNAEGPGAQKIGQDIVRFLSGDTRSLANTLFSPEEIKQMYVYARGMAATVPQRKAANPSGSGYEARRMAATAFQRLTGMFGFAQGGLEGAIVGEAAAKSMSRGGGWLAAKAATAGVLPNRSVVPGVTGGLLLEGEAKTAASDYLGVR